MRRLESDSLLAAFVGAGAMYFFDPVLGRRRRNVLIGRADRLSHAANDFVDKSTRDLVHRAEGLVAEAERVLKDDEGDDEVLAQRVRSRLGRVVAHPHAIEVRCDNGRVTVKGKVRADEKLRLLSRVARTRGVKEVVNELVPVHHLGSHPELQGAPRVRKDLAILRENWPPAVRLLVGSVGAGLFARGLAGHPFSGALGGLLLARAATNLDLRRLTGIGAGRRAISLQKTICVHAPIERVYEFWSDIENFPRFMSHVREVRALGENRFHWVVDGPGGIPVEWDALVTETRWMERIGWKSAPGATVAHTGTVHFERGPNGGTRVHIQMAYTPPGGALGHAAATIFGADPKHRLDEDMVRMKTFLETGHAPRDAAQR